MSKEWEEIAGEAAREHQLVRGPECCLGNSGHGFEEGYNFYSCRCGKWKRSCKDRGTAETEHIPHVILSAIQKARGKAGSVKWTIEKDAWDGCDGRTNYIKAGEERIAALIYLPGAERIVAAHNACLSEKEVSSNAEGVSSPKLPLCIDTLNRLKGYFCSIEHTDTRAKKWLLLINKALK